MANEINIARKLCSKIVCKNRAEVKLKIPQAKTFLDGLFSWQYNFISLVLGKTREVLNGSICSLAAYYGYR